MRRPRRLLFQTCIVSWPSAQYDLQGTTAQVCHVYLVWPIAITAGFVVSCTSLQDYRYLSNLYEDCSIYWKIDVAQKQETNSRSNSRPNKK